MVILFDGCRGYELPIRRMKEEDETRREYCMTMMAMRVTWSKDYAVTGA